MSQTQVFHFYFHKRTSYKESYEIGRNNDIIRFESSGTFRTVVDEDRCEQTLTMDFIKHKITNFTFTNFFNFVQLYLLSIQTKCIVYPFLKKNLFLQLPINSKIRPNGCQKYLILQYRRKQFY